MKSPDIISAVKPVVESFDKLGIPYYIGGSVASSTYGLARSTLDIDMVSDLKSETVHKLVKILEASYYIDEDDPTVEFYLASPEDNILNKLDWYRLGGGVSERQWNDVLGVLKVQKNLLDMKYLRHWASELRLVDLLEHALSDAGTD
jgi:hypothetical protein